MIKSAIIEYPSADGTILEGYVAYDDAKKAPRPGIIIGHEWMGLSELCRRKAETLAEEGYIALAADIFGKGVRPANQEGASALATKYRSDRPLLRQRMRAAYDTLRAMPQADAARIAVMGYCFGGTAALELARSGAALAGTASFHGGLATPTPQDAKNIKAPVLAMHGADDPFVPPAEVQAFQKEMGDAGVDLRFITYPGAVHSFTNPEAGSDNSTGLAYNAAADRESWTEFLKFLGGIFRE